MWVNSALARLGRAVLPAGAPVWRPLMTSSVNSTAPRMTRHPESLVSQSKVVAKYSTSLTAPPNSVSSSLSSLFQKAMRLTQPPNISTRGFATLEQMHKWGGPHKKFRPPRKPLDGKPMLKGVVLKTLIKKPKKPNSANRKCVLVRLSSGKEAIAYVPGIGHNLQEHNIVLVRCGRLQDVPGVKLKCIRGKYDLAHVQKQSPK